MSKARRDRLSSRKEDADERQAARSSRSNSEQIARLDKILGKGKGAAKERARLGKLIKLEKPTAKKKTKSKTEADAKPTERPKKKAKERRASEKK